MIDMEINEELLDQLFKQAKENPRLRQGFDLRTSPSDTSPIWLSGSERCMAHGGGDRAECDI